MAEADGTGRSRFWPRSGMVAVPTFHDQGRRLRKLASDPECRITFTGHARAEMRKDRIDEPDVLALLKRGAVVNVEGRLWTMRGHDSDGRTIEVVAEPKEDELRVMVVTAYED